ncbi:shugoshin 1 [Apodemus sylvaticus]|uniref:shugoshin 1 n=1 Tax=Apodemus sylvaticus TaxID=10129 RepID=UPI002243E956|nr:shugoshin 1 [Apodemus sylvaticus]XP_052048752.1 shugoshin 1 [Apodemus sylvaticus]
MAKERCQKRSFQDTLEDIKQRMKEKRNKNLAETRNRKSFIVAPSQVPTNTSTLLKYYQDNNRLLVLALENEKCKVREAQDIIVQLRRECYYLTRQLYSLKKMLTSRQSEEAAQNWKGRPSEVVSSIDNTARELSMKTLQETALEEPDCPYQATEPSATTTTPETLGCDFDSGKVESTNEVLPRTVSLRRHLQKDFSTISHSTALEDCKASPRVGQSLEDKSRCRDLTIILHRLENVEQNVCLWNKDQINLCCSPINPAKTTKTQEVILSSKLEQIESKHKRAQRRRAEQRRANQRCKSKSSLRSKGKKGRDEQPPAVNGCIGSSDAYDFNLKESVHHTPFQQKTSNGSNRESNSSSSEVSSREGSSSHEGSSSEDESDDLYLPPGKRLQDHTGLDRPVTRPRSKRGLKYPDEKEMEEVLPSTAPTGAPSETQESPHCSLKDVTNTLRRPIVKIRKLSLTSKCHEDSPAVCLPKRRCSTITNYKEPKLISKLRRGDPFTDVCFLNSPIFKQKKGRCPKRTKQTQ